MLSQQVRDYIKDHAAETYELLLTMAQIPAPSHHEELRAEFCKNRLEKMGAEGVYIDEAKNVVYPYCAEGEKPLVVFMAHMDVVFPDTEPLPLKEEGGRICCPGVGDDTANLAALMMAAKYVTTHALRPEKYGILFVCNSCEEGMGNLKGTRKICEVYGDRIREFYSFDGTMDGVVGCAVGSTRYQVTVKTEGGHSYAKFGNENAIANLAEIIHDLYQIQVPQIGYTTYNVGTMEGGTSVNTIAQEASMLCEYRSDREEALAIMKEKFEKIFSAHRSEKVQVEVETVGLRPCEHLEGEKLQRREEMVAEASALIEHITGKMPRTYSSSTDCNIPLSLGIPAVCYGTYYGAGAHTREEYVEKASLMYGYQVAMESVLKYFD